MTTATTANEDSQECPTAAGAWAAEEARRQAMVDGKLLTLADLLSDTLAYTHSTGLQDSKQSYLHKLSSGALRYEALEFVAPVIRVLGPVALVSAVMKATVQRGGSQRDVASSYLAVWENTPAGWKLQAVQATPLAATA
jgi:hypothetical protein